MWLSKCFPLKNMAFNMKQSFPAQRLKNFSNCPHRVIVPVPCGRAVEQKKKFTETKRRKKQLPLMQAIIIIELQK